jgi:hypothetical protein
MLRQQLLPEVLRNCIQDIVSHVTVEMERLKPKREDLVAREI